MIIHKPIITKDNEWVTVTTHFEMESNIEGMPESVWYRYPIEFAKHIEPERNEGGLASLLLIAMKYREDIDVRGVVSPKFAYQMKELQQVYKLNTPEGMFTPVLIEYEQIEVSQVKTGNQYGMTFSGGIDSSYILWSHIPENHTQPKKISKAFFIQGYDTFVEEETHFNKSFDQFAPELKQYGVELSKVITNVFDIYQFRLEWYLSHMPPLLVVPLHLQSLFSGFFVGGGYSFSAGTGKSPHLFSTESLSIVEQGITKNKIEKLSEMIDWSFVQKNLRVCKNHQKRDDLYACYQCSKCLYTAYMIHLLGGDGKFALFNKPFSVGMLFRWWLIEEHNVHYGTLHSNYLRKLKKLGPMTFFLIMKWTGVLKDPIYALVRRLVKKSDLYKMKAKLFPHH